MALKINSIILYSLSTICYSCLFCFIESWYGRSILTFPIIHSCSIYLFNLEMALILKSLLCIYLSLIIYYPYKRHVKRRFSMNISFLSIIFSNGYFNKKKNIIYILTYHFKYIFMHRLR